MAELELTRTPGDRRLYDLPGVGTLRLPGLFARVATAEADASRWQLRKRGLLGRAVDATDLRARRWRFEPHGLRRGGILRWNGRELALRPASAWRERYALADGDAELATVESKGWGRRPVKVVVEDDATLEAGLLRRLRRPRARRRGELRRGDRSDRRHLGQLAAAPACRGTSAGSAAAPSAVRPRARPGDGGCLRRVRRAGDPARARATTAAATAVGTDARPPALRPRGSTEPCRSRPRRAAAAARATTARPPATSGSGRRGGGRTASRAAAAGRRGAVRPVERQSRLCRSSSCTTPAGSPRSAIHSSSCG